MHSSTRENVLLWFGVKERQVCLLGMLHVGVCCAVVSVPCSLVVTCLERADLLSLVFGVFCQFPKYVLDHIRIKGEVGARRETGLSRSNAILLLWIIYVFLSCVCYVFVLVCLFVPCGHLLNLIDDTIIWYLNSKLDLNLSCAKDFQHLIFMVTWCIGWKRLLALIIFQRSSLK